MDKKYQGKLVAMPKDKLVILGRVRERLMEELGFEPSWSDVIAYLAHYWEKSQPKSENKSKE